MFEFLAGRASDWESPIVGVPHPVPPVPGPEVYDIRSGDLAWVNPGHAARRGTLAARRVTTHRTTLPWWARLPRDEEATLGSNNWAVSGARSKTGSAIVANDMHLRLAVPNIWYRATYVLPDERRPGQTRTLSGVTLPGGPQMAVGTNGDIAWGFTNSAGDWSDLVVIEPVPGDPTKYQTPDGPRAFDVVTESIAVKGFAPVPFEVRSTIWGPVVARDHLDRELASRWVAHDPAVLATDPGAHRARARRWTRRCRRPSARRWRRRTWSWATRSGRIAWTIYGAIPAPRRLHAATSPRRGPTARTAGTAISATTNIRASSIRRMAGCGRRMRARSTARCSRRSATAATPTASARG